MNSWRKLLLFTFIVLLPAIVVGISNFHVFPDSALSATIMLLITVGVAGIFTWQSSNATERVSRYCVLADLVICVILCVNLGGHWLLAREVSAARQGVEERHAEEDRELQRRKAETELDIARKNAEAELVRQNANLQNAESRRLARLPRDQRRSALTAPKAEAKVAPTPAPLELTPEPETKAEARPKLTPEQVRARWWWFLTALAFAECFASVVAGAILAGIWEWGPEQGRHSGSSAERRDLAEVARRGKIEAATARVPGATVAAANTRTTARQPTTANTHDDPNKPPRAMPNIYWTRKGGGWVLEFKKKVKHQWLYEYYGLLKLETWDDLKQRYQDEKLKGIIKGIILARRSELQRARDSRSGGHSLRLVGKRR